MPKINLLFVLPSLKRAGAEAQVVTLLNGLPEERVTKHLLYYVADTELLSSVNRRGVNVHSQIRRSKIDFEIVRRVARIIDEYEIDIVHCTLQNALIYGWAARLVASRSPRLICALHTTINVDRKNEIADRLVYKRLLRRCDQVWFVCRTQAEYWIDRMPFLGSRSKVIYNGIDPTYFSLDAHSIKDCHGKARMFSEDGVLIACIAGFRPEKGHLLLLDAFASLVDNECSAKLVFAGQGPFESSIRKRVSDKGLEDHVIFLGELQDVRSLLGETRCKVIPSTAVETFSIAMLEAMSMSVPVISSRIGGAAEAIENGNNGILFDIGDVDALGAAMRFFIDDEHAAREFGVRARETILERFTKKQMIESAVECIEEIMES